MNCKVRTGRWNSVLTIFFPQTGTATLVDWLVITADQPGVGRGVRGYALVWFLRTYVGRRRVKLRTPRQVRRGGLGWCDTLLVGLPTTLTPDEIRRLVAETRPRRIVAFDYLDCHELAWTPEQESVLRELSCRYFKPWYEPGWNYGLRMGMLPLRTNAQLFWAIAWDRLQQKLRRRPGPRCDVAFLGRPNTTSVLVAGEVKRIDQRVSWLKDLKSCQDIHLQGGLTEWNNANFRQRQAVDPSLGALCFERNRVSFPAYWDMLRKGRVVLSPGGNAPWTYRHYECLYAGGVVVTIDFRQRDMLVPLPREGMIHAPDEASVVPAVREALALRERRPELAEENFAHLERYLHYGCFSKSRPALFERFVAQLD
jgi:hypothetical protein